MSLRSPDPRPLQPGQREKNFQPEQDSGKVFKGHRCGDQTGSWGGSLFSCSWGLGVIWATLSQTFVPRNQVTCLSVSTDGSVLLSGSHDETVRLWDIQSKQCIRTVTLKGGAGSRRSRGCKLCGFAHLSTPQPLSQVLGGRTSERKVDGPFLDRWVGLRSGGYGNCGPGLAEAAPDWPPALSQAR